VPNTEAPSLGLTLGSLEEERYSLIASNDNRVMALRIASVRPAMYLAPALGASMARSRRQLFNCPHCDALYQVVKVEAGPETVDRQLTCRSCGGPLPSREGKFIIKYFMLRKAGRIQKWRKPARVRASEV
jgi:hypothetical protein